MEAASLNENFIGDWRTYFSRSRLLESGNELFKGLIQLDKKLSSGLQTVGVLAIELNLAMSICFYTYIIIIKSIILVVTIIIIFVNNLICGNHFMFAVIDNCFEMSYIKI